MKILLDTNFLIWAAEGRVPGKSIPYFKDLQNEFYFSAASIWEIAIKKQNFPDFQLELSMLRAELLANDYQEVSITTSHTVAVNNFPLIHKDPFDRILLAQAKTEGMFFLTANKILTRYDVPVFYCAGSR